MMKILRHPLAHLLLILVLGTLAYSNSFQVPFELDDLESIVDNPSIAALGNFLPGRPGYEFLPRRSVGYFTLGLNYHFGGLDVAGYHVFNLALHLCTALLLYSLVRLTFRTPQLSQSRLAPEAGIVALLASLFFLVHPVQTQAVTYIIQRLTSLSTLFFLLSLTLYAAARLSASRPGKTGSPDDRSRPALLIAGSVAGALLAMRTKEIAFTLPIAAALYEVSFFRGGWRRRALWLLPLLLTLPVVPLGVLAASGGAGTAAPLSPGAVQTAIPRLSYLFTQFPVIVTYLRLWIFPVGQNLDYDYPLFTTFFTPQVILSFLFLASFFGVGLHLHRRVAGEPGSPGHLSRDPLLRLVSFGIFWFFLTLSVESSLVPLADVIAEHRLYLPSAGLAIILAIGIALAAKRTTDVLGGAIPLITAALVLVALLVVTYQRNHVWGSSIRLWQDVVQKSPGKGRPWYNLGTNLTDGGEPQAAIPVLTRALELDPEKAEAWHNLGRAYLMTGRKAEAVRALREAVRLKPDMDNAAVNLSAALINSGRPAEAIPLLERVCRRYPAWPEPRLNLGLAYAGAGDLTAARRQLVLLQNLAPQLTPPLAQLLLQADTTPTHR